METSSRPMSRPEQMVRKFLVSRFGIWFGRYILPYLDLPILRLTRGKTSLSPGQPILLLVTTGAKTGKPRSTPLLYQRDGESLIVIASNGGRDYNPGWCYNLRADPVATVYLDGQVRSYHAREVQGNERATFWGKALAFFDGFAFYEQRTRRTIPVFVLEPISDARSSEPPA